MAAVVALPETVDPVNRISREKAAHLTMLYLGDQPLSPQQLSHLHDVVAEAARGVSPQVCAVTGRRELGADRADVLMVAPAALEPLRDRILADPEVRKLYDAASQYPQWTPHVTLSYPDDPPESDPVGIQRIRFDRLAVWDRDDCDGEVFPMNRWVPYTMTATAGICAPLPMRDPNKVDISLGLSQRDASQLVVGGVVGCDLSVPLLDLGAAGLIVPEDIQRLPEILAELAESQPSALRAQLSGLGGVTDGVLWIRPVIEGVHALQARMLMTLARAGVRFRHALPEQRMALAFHPDGAGDPELLLAGVSGQTGYFDRLVLHLAGNTLEFPFGMLGSAGPPAVPPATRFRVPLLTTARTALPLPVLWSTVSASGTARTLQVGRITEVHPDGSADGELSHPALEALLRSSESAQRIGLAVSPQDAVVRSVVLSVVGPLTAGAGITFSNEGLTPFVIPVLVPTETPTGDGRLFLRGSLSHRELPIPLLWQRETADGHDGSVVVGRIDSMDVSPAGLTNARGYLDIGEAAKTMEGLVRRGMLRGVSADLDQFEAAVDDDSDAELKKEPETLKSHQIRVAKARCMAVTAVPKPAFEEAYLILGEPEQESLSLIPVNIAECSIEFPEPPDKELDVPDGVYLGASTKVVDHDALVASAAPVVPPAEWFTNPGLSGPTPLTVTDEGRVFGHIAAWHVDHIGMPFGTRPPRSRSGYAFYHTGVCRTDAGTDVPVGQLTLAGGHAGLELGAEAARKHYDDTASAVADVHAGEDAYGIFVAGALRPGVTAEQVRTLRASAPSGDWRPVNGALEMVAVCYVNVPGYPVVQTRVASGYVTALVAAGARALAELRGPSAEQQLVLLQKAHMQELAQAAAQRFHQIASMSAIDGVTEFRAYSKETLEEYAKKGWAYQDKQTGHISFPIRDVADLRRAIRAYGRARKEDKPAVRAHILRRAGALDRPDLVPDAWVRTAAVSARLQLSRPNPNYELASTAIGLTASLRYTARREFDEELHPRDDHGKFRRVLYRIKEDLHDNVGTKDALDRVDAAIAAEEQHDTEGAKLAASRLIVELDKIADNTADLDDAQDLRNTGALLGEVLARLPLDQGTPYVKMRYSDLPAELQDLVEDLLWRLEMAVDTDTYNEIAGPVTKYISGADYMHSDELQSHLARIMRALV